MTYLLLTFSIIFGYKKQKALLCFEFVYEMVVTFRKREVGQDSGWNFVIVGKKIYYEN